MISQFDLLVLLFFLLQFVEDSLIEPKFGNLWWLARLLHLIGHLEVVLSSHFCAVWVAQRGTISCTLGHNSLVHLPILIAVLTFREDTQMPATLARKLPSS